MRIQLLSDLHLETEPGEFLPHPQAEVLILAGDIDSTWQAYRRFANWPVPVLVVAGNHEFDGREVSEVESNFGHYLADLGLHLLAQDSRVLQGEDGRRIRFCGTTRWSDFDVLGAHQRPRAMRAAGYFQRHMAARWHGQAFDAQAVRELGLSQRAWLEACLREPAETRWDATVAITHFAPSLRSADPRFGRQPGTASFCNADDDLIPLVDLWLHGHLHCRHDYTVERPAGSPSRVVCQARGLVRKGEDLGWDGQRLLCV